MAFALIMRYYGIPCTGPFLRYADYGGAIVTVGVLLGAVGRDYREKRHALKVIGYKANESLNPDDVRFQVKRRLWMYREDMKMHVAAIFTFGAYFWPLALGAYAFYEAVESTVSFYDQISQ